jgi:hypothetical protein
MISPSELDIQSTMENGGTCRKTADREKERRKMNRVLPVHRWTADSYNLQKKIRSPRLCYP